jgi:hypothetical protein
MCRWSLTQLAEEFLMGVAMSPRRSRSKGSGGLPAIIGLLFVIGLVVKFIWWILGALAIVAAVYIIRAVVRNGQANATAKARTNAAIAARADEQHNWVLQGDDRGVYGPEAARLMHYIDGGVSQEIAKRSQPQPQIPPRTGPFGTRFVRPSP